MSDMNLIMESWNKFLFEGEKEDLAQLKKSPKEVGDLIGQVAKIDPEQQKVAANFLVKDPQVQAAAKILKQLAAEQGIAEGVLADKMLSTYIQGSNKLADFFETPQGQQLKKFGAPVLAMALLALKIPDVLPDDAMAIAKIAGGNINAEDAAGTIIDVLNEEEEL
jgi:hypothetical protein